MNQRIKEIRLENKLNQEDFGKRIGITKASISRLESGENNPSTQTVYLICREFNINEIWLRTGMGEKHAILSDEDKYSINLGKLTINENKFVQNAINTLAETEPEKLKIIEDFMKKCLGIDN